MLAIGFEDMKILGGLTVFLQKPRRPILMAKLNAQIFPGYSYLLMQPAMLFIYDYIHFPGQVLVFFILF